ncbi:MULTISPECIES: hypothetical protein [Streptomyces]|uniref:Uncharacterized protein n=1 Tax=Streptomyces pseudovenezuelae TaxID=67350 RepID=A0ABZ1WQ28_9ACTN|nr:MULTISPECIES: hypothetical protein [Streptomyces]
MVGRLARPLRHRPAAAASWRVVDLLVKGAEPLVVDGAGEH